MADSDTDRDRLVHELEVHQAELMAQNEELRRTQDMLEDSRRRYMDLYDLAPAGYFTLSRDGMVIAANLTGAALLGTDRQAIVGRPFFRFLGRDYVRVFYDHLRAVIDGKASASVELPLLRRDGSTLWAHVDSAPVPPYEGSRRCWSVLTDVTERKRAQDALRESEERSRSIVDHSEDGIVLMGEDGSVLEWNRAQERITGIERQSAVGRPIWDVMTAAMPGGALGGRAVAEFRDGILDLLAGSSAAVAPMERQVRRPDGSVRTIQMLPFAVPGNGGHRAGAISRDITELQQALQAAAGERQRLATMLRSIGEGVLATDGDGLIVLMNQVAEAMTGWRESDAAGKPATQVLPLRDERTGKPLPNPVAQALESGAPVSVAGYAVLVPVNGVARPVMVNAAPLRNSTDHSAGAVVVLYDITEARRLEEAISTASKLEAVGLLAGGIAHDFNNLLTAIIGNIALSRMEAQEGTELYDMLMEAEKASLRAKDLTQQLLTFARGGSPVRRSASLAEVVQDSCAFALRGSKSTCAYSIADDLWQVEIDVGQISQVIQNLVLNADEAMPMGGPVSVVAGNVELTADNSLSLAPGKYVKLSVADQGVGIRRDHLPRIFDPYFTTKQKGSGLGLATSYSIVRRHDGLIVVDSAPGRGSKFTVYLPAATEQVEAPRAEPAADGIPRGTGRVLVMDDEKVVREVVRRILTRLGYEVTTANDGAEAVELVRKAHDEGKPFTAVILDLTVPGGMGGREAVQLMKQLDSGTRAIVSSGYSTDPVMARYQEHGFDGVAAKPFRFPELATELDRVIRAGRKGDAAGGPAQR